MPLRLPGANEIPAARAGRGAGSIGGAVAAARRIRQRYDGAMPKPRLAAMPNGPYYLINDPQPVEVPNLLRQSGKTCANVRGVALCRCGGSKKKPFCDGSQWAVGFRDP